MSATLSPARPLFVPPRPDVPSRPLSGREFLRAVRTNALRVWPERAYREEVLEQSFFGRRSVVMNAPDGIHHVLVTNAENYRRSAPSVRLLRPIVGEGLLLSQGEAWRHQRRTIAPALAPRVVPLLARHIASAAREAVGQLAEATGPVDLLRAMQQLALEIAGRSMFSIETAGIGARLRGMLEEFGGRHAQLHFLDLLLPRGFPSPRDFGRRRFQARWMAFMDELVGARLATPAPETPRDLFDLLRAARDPETGAAFTRPHLRDQVATMIVAGHETTATTLFWSLYLLSQAPEEQEALAAEARGLDLGPDQAGAALERLPRARAVVSEALRLYPPAFALAREPIRPDQWRDVRLTPRMLVTIAPWLLHRHERFWPEPDAFNPARFLPGAPPPPRHAYLPFGTGPRVCVGAQFALAEAALVLAAMTRAFEIAPAETEPVLPVALITLFPNRPATFRLRRRG